MLKIKNLSVKVNEKVLLKDFHLNVNRGEIHVVMGPNGAGKSTLAKAISGFPGYEITSGEIFYRGEDLLKLLPEERACKKIFVSFQYPIEISGISNFEFLYAAYKRLSSEEESRKNIDFSCKNLDLGKSSSPYSPSSLPKSSLKKPAFEKDAFENLLDEKMELLGIKKEFKTRSINEGFSGGEKKKNEILQMALFNPHLSILDEIDSGLDVDALKMITEVLLKLKSKDNSFVFITHYMRLLDYITPDFVHVLINGKIVKTGGMEIAKEIEKNGFEPFKDL
jgi:Fe-S cluster assembly ATP-binding protein